MTVELWIGQEFDTTHERRALENFIAKMNSRFGASRQLYIVLANYFIEGRQVDLTVLKRDAVIVIELKEFDRPFRAAENGSWLTIPDGKITIGTANQNPFEQVSFYRRLWMNYLNKNKHKFLPINKAKGLNFSHISAFVVISPSLPPQTQIDIPPHLIWFQLVGLDQLPQIINQQTSRKLHFSDMELRKLVGVDCLNLRPAPGILRHVQYKPGNLPIKPNLLIGREQAIAYLKSRFGVNNKSLPQPITIIRGWPGVGKTTIAATLAHDSDINSIFPDGILWTALGETPNVLELLTSWGRALSFNNLSLGRTIEEINTKLTALLKDKKILLIIDDVWKTEHARPFLIGGHKCAILITTRFPHTAHHLAPTIDNIYNLPVLSDKKSMELLTKIAPEVVKQQLDACYKLVHNLEGLPLAIQVAGGLLNEEASLGWNVNDLLLELQESTKLLQAEAPVDRINLTNQTTPTITSLLQQSTKRLDPSTKDYFAFLGAFAPKPATFDLQAIAGVWGVAEPKPIVRNLVRRGLLEPVEDRFQMHALLVMHAKSMLED